MLLVVRKGQHQIQRTGMQVSTGLEFTVEEALAILPSGTSREDPQLWSVEHVSQVKPSLTEHVFCHMDVVLRVHVACAGSVSGNQGFPPPAITKVEGRNVRASCQPQNFVQSVREMLRVCRV